MAELEFKGGVISSRESYRLFLLPENNCQRTKTFSNEGKTKKTKKQAAFPLAGPKLGGS